MHVHCSIQDNNSLCETVNTFTITQDNKTTVIFQSIGIETRDAQENYVAPTSNIRRRINISDANNILFSYDTSSGHVTVDLNAYAMEPEKSNCDSTKQEPEVCKLRKQVKGIK